jgi:hypothetical protein
MFQLTEFMMWGWFTWGAYVQQLKDHIKIVSSWMQKMGYFGSFGRGWIVYIWPYYPQTGRQA